MTLNTLDIILLQKKQYKLSVMSIVIHHLFFRHYWLF